ncbi:RecQ family ATP-dependent DNA helicase [Rudanella paleaurantiibacter]|uniref:ATP-dependent DNA helicase RecQ n=1 Tax=Rudanella paleaurantiibacter TaxID=2614655 RepID=A0A7J5U3I0_9BACT|nr:ATP-dependent DNA helicase RecQ [Rudanella paleaurantiibacter]KAB7732251.1 RecQ family ATP-dependent DNA helicase [Rudanella paleaurantiibacter]
MTPHDILRQYWGYSAFRPLQEDIVNTVLAGHDTLVLMPTGGGKSLCYQVPTLVMEGVCIVVTPLIALMKDQVEQLKRRNIPAAAIFSGMHWREIDATLDNCIYGNTKFLYVSPERLQTEIVIERARKMNICLIAVDEAHCISAWGYDFRPPYLKIADFRALLPKPVSLIALTASATPEVQADIQARLAMQNPHVFRQTFARPNLSYSALPEAEKESRLLRILGNVPGSAVVYVRSRRQTQQVAEFLYRNGVSADFYHAGLTTQQRDAKQSAWINNQIRVIVATNAFGMGIDKPDVRVVVHLDVPDTPEAYYQEAGRAGRDGKKAYAVLLYTPADLSTVEARTEQQYPSVELIRRTYQALANYTAVPTGAGQFASYDFDMHTFVTTFQLPPQDTHFALKQLEHEGFIGLTESYFRPSRLMMSVNNRELYEFQLRNPRYEPFIKLVLRMYGGELFTDFMTISETALARAFLIDQKEIEAMLQQLHERNVLIYEKQKDKPQLTFLTPRFDTSRLPIDTQLLDERKQRAMTKVRAMVRYVQNDTQCRTRLLQAYFGEEPGEACGICDNCVKKKPRPEPTQAVREQVWQYVHQADGAGVSPRQLADYFAQTNADVLAQAVQQMLAEEVLQYNAGGNLTLRAE